MGKLTKERLWCLAWWKNDGWSLGRPMSRGIKKWEHHIDMLVKDGLLERDGDGALGASLCRITPEGRAALESETK